MSEQLVLQLKRVDFGCFLFFFFEYNSSPESTFQISDEGKGGNLGSKAKKRRG